MLKSISESSAFMRVNGLKYLTVCYKKIFKKVQLQVFEYESGDSFVYPVSAGIKVDLIGALYAKNSNIEVYTKIPAGKELERIAICTSKWTGKRVIEVVEMTDGSVVVTPLSKDIITEKVDAAYIKAEIERIAK